MKKHHIDRLEKLYNFLGTIKPKKFYWGEWGLNNGYCDKTPDLNACGTTACALGWAGSMPEFRKRGLKLVWDPNWEESNVEFVDKDENLFFGEIAGAEFFGLTIDEAIELFIPEDVSPEAYNMPLGRYRRKLRRFIDRKKKELKIAA